MTKPKCPPQVGTVGSTIADGLHVTIYCDVSACDHSQTLYLEALAHELGADYAIADFVAGQVKQVRCEVAEAIG